MTARSSHPGPRNARRRAWPVADVPAVSRCGRTRRGGPAGVGHRPGSRVVWQLTTPHGDAGADGGAVPARRGADPGAADLPRARDCLRARPDRGGSSCWCRRAGGTSTSRRSHRTPQLQRPVRSLTVIDRCAADRRPGATSAAAPRDDRGALDLLHVRDDRRSQRRDAYRHLGDRRRRGHGEAGWTSARRPHRHGLPDRSHRRLRRVAHLQRCCAGATLVFTEYVEPDSVCELLA
jgi:hypothetical protein